MPWNPQFNTARQATASERDRARGLAVLASRIPLSPRQEQVIAVRVACPDLTWTQVASHLGMTRGQAWGVWRRVMQRTDTRRVLGARR